MTHAEHFLYIQAGESEFKSPYRAVPTLLGIRKGSIFTAPEQKVMFFAQKENDASSLNVSQTVFCLPPRN